MAITTITKTPIVTKTTTTNPAASYKTTTTPGQLSYTSGGVQYIATPTATTTQAQTAAAQASGWNPVKTGQSYTATGPTIQGGQTLPTQDIKPTITADQLGKVPEAKLPTVAPPLYNQNAALVGNIATGADVTTGLQTIIAPTTVTQTPAEKARADYLASIQAPVSTTEALRQAEQESGLRRAQQEKINIQNSLNAETTRMNLDLQSLRGVGAREGVTEAVYGQQASEVTREGMARILPLQAQLALAQDNLALAQERTDTLFKSYVTDAENKRDYYNKVAELNYGFFTEDEKQRLADLKTVQDVNLSQYNARINMINNAALKALDNGNVALYKSLTKNPPPAYTLDGTYNNKFNQWSTSMNQNIESYGGDTFDGYLPEIDIKKIDASPQGKKIIALGALKQKVNTYSDLVKQYGTETPLGGQKSLLDSAYADLKIAYKEAANLGALTGPDVALIEEAIKPATYGGIFAPITRIAGVIFGGSQGKILDSLDQATKTIDKEAVKNISELNARDKRYINSFYVNEITQPFSSVTNMSTTEINNSLDNLSESQLQELRDAGLL